MFRCTKNYWFAKVRHVSSSFCVVKTSTIVLGYILVWCRFRFVYAVITEKVHSLLDHDDGWRFLPLNWRFLPPNWRILPPHRRLHALRAPPHFDGPSPWPGDCRTNGARICLCICHLEIIIEPSSRPSSRCGCPLHGISGLLGSGRHP